MAKRKVMVFNVLCLPVKAGPLTEKRARDWLESEHGDWQALCSDLVGDASRRERGSLSLLAQGLGEMVEACVAAIAGRSVEIYSCFTVQDSKLNNMTDVTFDALAIVSASLRVEEGGIQADTTRALKRLVKALRRFTQNADAANHEALRIQNSERTDRELAQLDIEVDRLSTLCSDSSSEFAKQLKPIFAESKEREEPLYRDLQVARYSRDLHESEKYGARHPGEPPDGWTSDMVAP